MDTPPFANLCRTAIRFWDRRRLVYNALLSVIVLFYFFRAYPVSKAVLRSFDPGDVSLVVLANVAYCAAYVADAFAQWSCIVTLEAIPLGLVCGWYVFRGILTRFIAIAFSGQTPASFASFVLWRLRPARCFPEQVRLDCDFSAALAK